MRSRSEYSKANSHEHRKRNFILEASTGLQAIDTGRQCGPLSLFITMSNFLMLPGPT